MLAHSSLQLAATISPLSVPVGSAYNLRTSNIRMRMLARLNLRRTPTAGTLPKHSHFLFMVPPSKSLAPDWPGHEVLASLMSRRRLKTGDLAKAPVMGNLKDGALASWIMFDNEKSAFEQQAA